MKLRGWDFFVMSLAHALGMTRRMLLKNLDSSELTYWSAYFEEMNKPAEKKQNPKKMESDLKGVLQGKAKVRKHA